MTKLEKYEQTLKGIETRKNGLLQAIKDNPWRAVLNSNKAKLAKLEREAEKIRNLIAELAILEGEDDEIPKV